MKKIFAILMVAVIFAFSGCSQETNIGAESTIYKLKSERYPLLSLETDGSFILEHDVMATDITEGTYSLEESTLKLLADDGSEYFFEIDENSMSLTFLGDISDEFTLSNKENSKITNNAEFELYS